MSDLLKLEGKLALVTGASRGIGRAITTAFAENGATLFITGRNEDCLTSFANELRENFSSEVHTFVYDVSNINQVKENFGKIFKVSKKLDIIVNNAGIFEPALIPTITQDSIEKLTKTNLWGALYHIQYGSKLLQRNGGGSIINLSSVLAQKGYIGQTLYSAVKSALYGLTKSSAKELASFNIRVNSLSPGFIDTDMTKGVSEAERNSVTSNILLKRLGKPEDVANAALFLASNLSNYITGIDIPVDGGMII